MSRARASAVSEVAADVLAVGMNDFLTKPFEPSNLRQKIAHWLRRIPV